MKIYKLISIILLTMIGCEDNDDKCNSLVDPDKNSYIIDAKRLVLREIISNNDHFKDSVNIPDSLYQPIANALWAVHSLKNSPERDMIIDSFKIHTLINDPEMKGILVLVDSTKSWVKTWRNGQLSENRQIDELMCKYDLSIESIDHYGNASYLFSLTAHNSLNIIALAQHFEAIEGVIYAESNPVILPWSFNDIQLIKQSNYFDLIYSYNFGDCPSGCTCHHYWNFRIFNQDSAVFISESGDPIDGCD